MSKAVNLEASLLAAANVQASVPDQPAAVVQGAARRPDPSRPVTCAVQVSMANFLFDLISDGLYWNILRSKPS